MIRPTAGEPLPGPPGALGMLLHDVTCYLHAGCLVTLADTACGYATVTANGNGDTHLLAVFRCTQLVPERRP